MRNDLPFAASSFPEPAFRLSVPFEQGNARSSGADSFGTPDGASDMSFFESSNVDDLPSDKSSFPRSISSSEEIMPSIGNASAKEQNHVETALVAPSDVHGQPLIVPPREAALTVKGNFSYVEIIGSMVLFVESTLSEVIVRDGGMCILERCTITDELANPTDDNSNHAAILCSENSCVEIRGCTILSSNIGIVCKGVLRCLTSTIKSRCGIWISEHGAALVTKCTFASVGKDFVSQGDGLFYADDEEDPCVRLLAQSPGGIRPFPCELAIPDTDGRCFSRMRESGQWLVVPDDYPTLQQALDASRFGDTVELLCFVRGPVNIPAGVRLLGGSIESFHHIDTRSLITLQPFALLEACDVMSTSKIRHTAVHALHGSLVARCYIRNDMGVGVVCERGASICHTNVNDCHTGIVMEDNSVWCFRNIVRYCRLAGIIASRCLVEENRLSYCRLSVTSCHALNNVAETGWCSNSAVSRNKFVTEPMLINCVESAAPLVKKDSRNIAFIMETGNALMRQYDKTYGILPLDSCAPPPPINDRHILHDLNFDQQCQQASPDVSIPKRVSIFSGSPSPARRITLEYYEKLMLSRRKRMPRRPKPARKSVGTLPLTGVEVVDFKPDTSTIGSMPQFSEADVLSGSPHNEVLASVSLAADASNDNNEEICKPSFHLQRLRWALCSARTLQGADMFLLPCAIQAKQWSNGHKGVEQSFINPPTTCHFVNTSLNTVECGFILLEAIKQGMIDKELLASALGRDQHSRLRVTFTRMWASSFVKEEWSAIQRSATEESQAKRRPLRELFRIQRESKGKVAATFFVSAMRSFFSRTLRLVGVEADSVLRLVEDFGSALAKSSEFCHHFEQCILPPAERTQYKNVEDVVFALAYAVIMLNTSLHNKSTKQPMGKQEFITFGEQTHCSKDILRYVYKKVKEKEL